MRKRMHYDTNFGTIHNYQPGTRRSCWVLEWPAMLRLLDAEDRSSGFPSWRQ